MANLEADFVLHRAGEAKKYFEVLDDKDRNEYISDYNAGQPIKVLRLGEKSAQAAKTAFWNWLAKHLWGEPSKDDLLAFAASKLSEA